MHPLRAVLALRLAAACAPRYINVGMPKCGSTSVSSFYRCHGMTSAHWISRGDFVGDEAHACDARGRPLLDCGPCRDVYAQIDVENPPGHCWFPQITHLAGLVQDYGNATFLLPTRNATASAAVRSSSRRNATHSAHVHLGHTRDLARVSHQRVFTLVVQKSIADVARTTSAFRGPFGRERSLERDDRSRVRLVRSSRGTRFQDKEGQAPLHL